MQLITFGGEVVTQTHPASSTFTWQPIVPVTPGEHYYYVKVTQADGDRIVTFADLGARRRSTSRSPISPIEPTIASIYNPSLITARVTNRMATDADRHRDVPDSGSGSAILDHDGARPV